jgi:hypothetical protein
MKRYLLALFLFSPKMSSNNLLVNKQHSRVPDFTVDMRVVGKILHFMANDDVSSLVVPSGALFLKIPPSEDSVPVVNEVRRRKTLSVSKINSVWRKMYNEMDAVCLLCEQSKMSINDRTTWEVAHVKPFVDGGEDELDNLRPLCRSCNRKMGRHHFRDYILTHHENRYIALKELFDI